MLLSSNAPRGKRRLHTTGRANIDVVVTDVAHVAGVKRATLLTLEESLQATVETDVLAVTARGSRAHSSVDRYAVLAARGIPAQLAKSLVVRIRHRTDTHNLSAARAVESVVIVARAILALSTEDTDSAAGAGWEQRHTACIPVAARLARADAVEAAREERAGAHFVFCIRILSSFVNGDFNFRKNKVCFFLRWGFQKIITGLSRTKVAVRTPKSDSMVPLAEM